MAGIGGLVFAFTLRILMFFRDSTVIFLINKNDSHCRIQSWQQVKASLAILSISGSKRDVTADMQVAWESLEERRLKGETWLRIGHMKHMT